MPELSLDYETYSECDLKAEGAHRYAEHKSTDVLCAAYAFDDDEPEIWLPGDPIPPAVEDHILCGGIVNAWNAQFERLIWKHVMGPKYGWVVPDLEQYRCTMARAYAMNLPGSLKDAAPAVGLTLKKDDAGARIMMKLCKPRPSGKGRWTPKNAPGQFGILYDYCKQDVRVEHAVGKRVVKLSAEEQRVWFLDQRINDRGVCVDIDLIEAAARVVNVEKERLDKEMREVTSGEVVSTSAVEQLKQWLRRSGLEVDKLDKDAVSRILARDDLTNTQRVAVQLRQEAGKTSTAKLNAFRRRRCKDGSIKGTLQYHGAGTGRWAARGLQVQNFPRPDPGLKTNIKAAIADIMDGDVDWIRAAHGPPLSIVADCLRGMIVARPGKKLWSRDLSSIEARVLPWLAHEKRVVQAFRDYDTIIGENDKGEPIRKGPDIYKVTAANSVFGCSLSEVDDPKRQVGKVATLALGFGGGAGAFASMAKIYRVDVGLIFPLLWELATDENQEKCREAWDQRGRRSGLTKERWQASELVKLAWRDANANIVQFWRDLEDAAISACRRPGETFNAGYIKYRKTGTFLRCVLPSGRSIFYPYPKLVEEEMPWGGTREQLRYKAVDGYTRKFSEQKFYGGLAAENVTQATARDVMVHGLMLAESKGYRCVMTVHDENVAETDIDFGNEDEFHACMTDVPPWAPGLPVAADGWTKERYGK